jgi:formamidopyrimidine-DNA glycosylase
MPELPDILLYQHALEKRVCGVRLDRVRIRTPFVLRSVAPPIADAEGRTVLGVDRIGKRLVIALEGDRFLVLHLMIAGRLRWLARGGKPPGKIGLATFDFESGTLALTEAGSKRRASLHFVAGRNALREFDRGGLDVLRASLEQFAAVIRRESHTLKRSLTDPTVLDGIGNAYSDEILHQARLSPFLLTGRITASEMERLYQAARRTLSYWIEKLEREAGGEWPEKVTAFREGMAVHGRYGQPCPVCNTPVQRIRYADNETNYCPACQTEGRLLADRGLSRLLRDDWPRSLDEMEEHLRERHLGSG